MKKSILFISLLTFVLTGCTATYSINIDKDFVKENLSVIETDSSVLNNPCFNSIDTTCKEIISLQKEEIAPVYFEDRLLNPDKLSPDKIYNISLYNSSKGMGYTYNYDFTINDYKSSNIAKSCIDSFEVKKLTDGSISVDAQGYFRCEYNHLEDVYIEVSSDYYTIVNANSISRKDNKYIWKIDLVEKNNIHFELRDDTKNKASYNLIMGILITVVTALIVFLIIGVIKNKNNNNI